jgi:F420-dependent oxidoreductase-like protein
MRVCLMIEGQEDVTWDHWVALADACERLGFEGLFRSDHYGSVFGADGRGSTDAWTLLAALAGRTERLRLGTLVSPVTFRAPAVLAKAAVTVDQISGGRAEIGMGAGWMEAEHRAHGFAFPPTPERFSMLEEQLEIVHGLLKEDVYSFHGTHYDLEDVRFLPKGVQDPHPPIVLGGKRVGPRMQRLIGRFADEFNTVGGTPDEVRGRFERARAGIDAAARDQATLTTSLMTWFFVGASDDEYLAKLETARRRDPNAGSFDEYRADIERDCIVGTPERALERLAEYADAGVQRVFLNHELYEDLDMLELVAQQVIPEASRL